MPQLPSGTVTFVFSDIEGSTTLLKQLGDEGYANALATHRRLVREAFADNGGQEIDTQGDAFFYSFTRAREAVAAAVAVQRAHASHPWPDGGRVRVRLGLHTGEPAVGDEGYTGLDVVRASRIAAVARGGQVLLSEATRAIVSSHLPDGVELRTVGQHQLKDIDEPEILSELVVSGVPEPAGPEPGPKAVAVPAAVPGLPKTLGDISSMPEWLRGAADRLLPQSSRMIEERVLAQIEKAFEEKSAARTPRRSRQRTPRPPAPPQAARRSVAEELSRLSDLRDAGAITGEQYERAVERTLAADP